MDEGLEFPPRTKGKVHNGWLGGNIGPSLRLGSYAISHKLESLPEKESPKGRDLLVLEVGIKAYNR